MENGILHVDMNNFYASVETLFHPEYRDVPMAVAGDPENRHGIILAKNMLAKAKGVKTAEPIWQAKRKCPGLQICPPHHDRYQEYSKRAFAIYCRYTDRVESFGLDECWLDVYHSEKLFGDGYEIAQQIRKAVKEELGLTVSIGVSFNKVFAKLGSDYKKPDAVTVFGRDKLETVIWKLPCEALLFVGPSTRKTLKKYGLHTIGDIASMELPTMRGLLGRMGESLWKYARGLDDSPVASIDAHEAAKSIGHSVTLPRDITTEEEVRATLLSLSESVASGLRKQGVKAGEVQLTVRNGDFEEFQRQCRIDPPACDSQSLYAAALGLYRRENKRWAVRLLGVRAGKLTENDSGQISLFDDGEERKRREQLEKAVDAVRGKFGRESVSRALVMGRKTDREKPQKGGSGNG